MTEAEQAAARELLTEMQDALKEARAELAEKDNTITAQTTELEALRAYRSAVESDTSLAVFFGEMRAWFDEYRQEKTAPAQ